MQKVAVMSYFNPYYPRIFPEKLMRTIKRLQAKLITGWESNPGLREYEVGILHQ
jgi:hypothetical protein